MRPVPFREDFHDFSNTLLQVRCARPALYQAIHFVSGLQPETQVGSARHVLTTWQLPEPLYAVVAV